ncbi:hypothetical protein MKW94_018035 [Papaver nudicaule]|uniref:Uncharacterized protein n=1 Tax=Papaver nudicaule TaxID=74823 RepID=A0AA41VGN9_PAPNU|nr:hypothetical protein [Papaver nudicaule]
MSIPNLSNSFVIVAALLISNLNAFYITLTEKRFVCCSTRSLRGRSTLFQLETSQFKFLGHEIKINVPNEDADLITSSGDQTCVLRDVTTGQRVSVFGGEFPSGHTADVLCVSINASDQSIFDSGSCNTTARLWDSRKGSRAVCTYHGHKGDVNTVKFFPDGQRFENGSDDGTCRLFDVGTGHELQVYHQHDSVPAVTSRYSNGDCYVGDTLLAKVRAPFQFSTRSTCLGLIKVL